MNIYGNIHVGAKIPQSFTRTSMHYRFIVNEDTIITTDIDAITQQWWHDGS